VESISYRIIPVGLIHESPLNPRKVFRELDDLTASIQSKGILTPLLARPKAGFLPLREEYELAAGHRRLRAAILAGLQEVPVIVREMDDTTFLEVLTIENLQRENIHPMEECAGFAALLLQPGYSREVLAEKVGKSVSYIAKRLELASLIPAAQQAFAEDKISLSHALELCRISAESQARALEEDDAVFGFTTHAQQGKELLPVSVLREWIQSEVLLELRTAPWDRGSATLLPAAGACTTCPKRTAANAVLFDDLPAKGDRCLDPACYAAKASALVQLVKQRAAEADKPLKTATTNYMGDNEMKKVGADEYISTWQIKSKSNQRDEPTEKVLVVHGPRMGEVVEVYKRSNGAAKSHEKSAEQLKRERERKIDALARKNAFLDLVRKLRTQPLNRGVLQFLVQSFSSAAIADLKKAWGLDRLDLPTNAPECIRHHAETAEAAELQALLIGLAAVDLLKEYWSEDYGGGALKAFLKEQKIDLKVLRKDAELQLDTQDAEKRRRAANRPEKKAAVKKAKKAKKTKRAPKGRP
jgi:ParB family chromosome partitioning protein